VERETPNPNPNPNPNPKQERVERETPDGVSVGVDDANVCVWVATIFGPAETLWDGGMFQVELVF